MERVVDEAVATINMHLNELVKVPPLMLSRLASGGKTLTLYRIFEKLRQQNINVMFISFNDSGGTKFERQPGESDKQAIMRAIASQLMDCNANDKRHLQVDEAKLLQVLAGQELVLLVDDLHILGESL